MTHHNDRYLDKYVKDHGKFPIQKYVATGQDGEAIKLGPWLTKQKERQAQLTPARKAKLESITTSFPWAKKKEHSTDTIAPFPLSVCVYKCVCPSPPPSLPRSLVSVRLTKALTFDVECLREFEYFLGGWAAILWSCKASLAYLSAFHIAC